MNKVIMMGRLVKDVETISTNGDTMVKFSIAVSRNYKGNDGIDTDFFNCVAFRKTGEFIQKYFVKGKPILITGKINNRKYEEKIYTQITVDTADFVLTDKSGASIDNFALVGNDIKQPEFNKTETEEENLPF
jgi:single-strand DNA-binding protein